VGEEEAVGVVFLFDLGEVGLVGAPVGILLWVSVVIYAIGVFVAYALGPILMRLDNA
jgi:hypothetical protein